MTAAHQLDAAPESAPRARLLPAPLLPARCVEGAPTRADGRVLAPYLHSAEPDQVAAQAALDDLAVRHVMARAQAALAAPWLRWTRPAVVALDDPELACGGRAGDPALAWDDVDGGG